MYKTLFLFLLLTANLFSKNIIIAGNFVNIRKEPNIASEVLLVVTNGQHFEIEENNNSYFFVENFYGKWEKIKLGPGKFGFVFSSFLQEEAQPKEQFHIFFNNLTNLITRQKTNEILKLVNFPFSYVDFHESKYFDLLETSNTFSYSFFGKFSRFKLKQIIFSVSEKTNWVYASFYYINPPGKIVMPSNLYFSKVNENWKIMRYQVAFD